MKQKTKQLIMTLVALLALTTHAWATDPTVYDRGDVELYSLQVGDILMPGVTLTNKGNKDVDATLNSNRFSRDGVTQSLGSSISTIPFSIGLNGLINSKLSGNNGPYDCMPITEDGEVGNAWVVTYISTASYRPNYKGINLGGIKVVPPATPFAITWSAETPNTASIDKMPAGNVTVSVEYFPQAEFATSTGETPEPLAPTAIADVPATTDGPIVKAGTVANIGETTTAQGTVMYYVSTTEMTDAQLQALTPDKWSADVPTAADLAQGAAYVYYYIQGAEPATIAERTDANTCSDGDILAANVVNVTLAAAPLWNAEFDLTNAPEEDKAPGVWSTDIPEGGVVKGTEVTVTYTGTKKIIGVKAEKKKVAEGHALSASAVGEIVGSDGNVYAVADKDNLPDGVTAVAMVAYKSATAGSSLAIALADEGSMNWNSAKGTCASKAAIGGKSWKLPTKDEWDQMFSANGGSTGLKTALSAAGGASSTLQNGNYWSSTEVVLDPEDDPDMAWLYSFGDVRWYWDDMVHGNQVRACLAF